MVPSQIYRTSLGLLTDFYQLTMACAAWKGGMAEREATFHLTFRRPPFEGGYGVAAGLEHVVDRIENTRIDSEDLAYLARQVGGDGTPLFEPAFLEWLGGVRLEVDVDAVPEGTVIFAHEPMLRVSGPIVPCMLLETPILNAVGFQTLIATKAARVVREAGPAPVMEFGLRRAPGIDGALAASRAAWVGGISSTSNVLAGRLHGIPVMGTHAHSWVMLFDDELESFLAFAKAMPANAILLVDTYDTLAGVDHAIEVGRWLEERGHRLAGIRLDSGDLAWLSQEARRRLDAAGMADAVVVASNELDEFVIQALRGQDAAIGAWGVGTRLVTGWGEPALGCVYKLSATRPSPGAPWTPRVKLSEQVAKTSVPGRLQVRRYTTPEGYLADAVYDVDAGIPDAPEIVDPLDATRRRVIHAGTPWEDLLRPAIRRGKAVEPSPPLEEARTRARTQLDHFHSGVKRLLHPHRYPVGLERGLHDLRTRLVLEARHVAG